MIAMVDCNSFYASCEQVFRPDLKGRPVAVLSNNDGCIIAKNKEAKALTHIPYRDPLFKIKGLLAQNDVTLFSSNYTLYGDMSDRVMNVLREFSPAVEVYSIDESFVDLSGMTHVDLNAYGHQIKNTIVQRTGIPVGVGIAPTKVLAKLANRISKKVAHFDHVYVMDTEERRIEALNWAETKDIWGLGKKHVERLAHIGVFTAYAFTEVPLAWVRKEMTVVGERLWRELNGESCIPFETLPRKKKAIGTAKSFGKKLDNLPQIEEACAYYISEVSEVLRSQKCCCTQLRVYLTTNYHSTNDVQHADKTIVTLSVPTNDTFMLIVEAKKALKRIYKLGFKYKKVGVDLLGLIPEEQVQGNLFMPEATGDKRLIKAFDAINNRYGKSTVSAGLSGTSKSNKEWELIKEERSPRYTTQWDSLLEIGKG